MLSIVYRSDQTQYPGCNDSFSPSQSYPEYPFPAEQLSGVDNTVYDMVRELLKISGLDREHFDTPDWNPLGDGIIKPGDTVLLKPNWVDNKNKTNRDNLSCLVTNPAVVRAVTDYVIIALKGIGRIIIADAPMQGCDLQDLFRKTGYNDLFEFYKGVGIDITVLDLRKYSVGEKYKGVTGEIQYNENEGSVEIDLGKRSLHSIHDGDHSEYRVEDYSRNEMAVYHADGKHVYSVSSTMLNADVIINLPKPKTHRLAGMTGAIKNFVGMTYDKACLPHRREGDKETGRGDAYSRKSVWKQWMGAFNEQRTVSAKNGKFIKAKLFDFLMKGSYVIGAKTSGDSYRIGSWYGNDTIWRTAVDLNNIALHVDRDGNYHENIVRRIISIGDMIVAGEKEGPVGPSPKPLGILVLSDSAMLFDLLVCHIMGFSDEKLPMFNNEQAWKVFGFVSKRQLLRAQVEANKPELHRQIMALQVPAEWRFEPHSCWKGHIEA